MLSLCVVIRGLNSRFFSKCPAIAKWSETAVGCSSGCFWMARRRNGASVFAKTIWTLASRFAFPVYCVLRLLHWIMYTKLKEEQVI